ncbi:unnamed protein product, partial [Vitis vinifera]
MACFSTRPMMIPISVDKTTRN